jgi:hypothetical protein
LREAAARFYAVTRFATLALLAGCSWITVDHPPRHPQPSTVVVCDDSYLTPAADFAGFGLLVGFALIGTGFSFIDGDGPQRTGTMILGSMIGAGGMFGLSGYYGYHHVRRCRSFKGLPLEDE